MNVAELYETLRAQVERVVIGQGEVVELSLAALLSNGHVLLEGVPGTAKTLLVRTIATVLRMDFKRVQMTPDLLPADVTGSSVWRKDRDAFEFVQGPIFAHFVLADEINRASARTQSALLEAMQEHAVTWDGSTHRLPEPFILFATQNPIEQEGTYPLPLAQLDRFMFKVLVDYPDGEAEEEILRRHHAHGLDVSAATSQLEAILEPAMVNAARQVIRETFVRDEVIQYVRRLGRATREDDALSVGASPRALLMLLMAAKCLARFDGRDFVTPDDIQAALKPCLRHRVVLSPATELEGVAVDDVLDELVQAIEVPR